MGPRDRVAFRLAAVTDYHPQNSLTLSITMLVMLAVPLLVLPLAPRLAVQQSVFYWLFVALELLLILATVAMAVRIRRLRNRMQGLGYTWVDTSGASHIYHAAGRDILAVDDLPRAEILAAQVELRRGDVPGLLKALFPTDSVRDRVEEFRLRQEAMLGSEATGQHLLLLVANLFLMGVVNRAGELLPVDDPLRLLLVMILQGVLAGGLYLAIFGKHLTLSTPRFWRRMMPRRRGRPG